jgi:cyclase
MKFKLLTLTVLLLLVPASLLGGAARPFVVTRVTADVYVISSVETLRQPLDGNVTVLINERDVIVVDATQTMTSARAVSDEIKKLTDKPVRYLINTHWHNDHQQGNRAFLQTWPGLEIIAHRLTREDILTEGVQVLQARIRQQQNRAQAQKLLDAGKDAQGQPLSEAVKHRLRERLGIPANHLQELQEITITPPTLTYEGQLTLQRGNREIRLFSHGPGNTRSDTILWLPQERIVISGDLLTSTAPFMSESRPRGWLARLREIAALDPLVIIPGHGALQRDRHYLNLHIALLESLIAQVDAALQQGLSLEETRRQVKLEAFREQYSQGDALLRNEFDYRVTETTIAAAWREGKETTTKKNE